MPKLSKTYEPKKYEAEIYKRWEESGAFKPVARGSKERYSISLPPPNATGSLHLGHTMMLAIQDAFIRYQRMLGKETLWLPGTDHAAIATESIVIKNLQQEGIDDPRKELGREELVKRIAAYVEASRDTIRNQVRKMGASLDWEHERYTLDPTLNRCVNEVFVKMYNDGLVYRGHRIVNWDPRLQTTVSDDEVDRKEEKAPFYILQYGPFQIGTARPETKFGDKYVVMHPKDKRYAKYKEGDTFEAEWINGAVRATVIKDEAIDPQFGTGVMTITPWHDATDFEIAERHGLDKEQVIDYNGHLLPIAGEFTGMPISKARPKIVAKLKSKGLLVKTDKNYVHNIAINNRGKGVIEPQIKEQWFVDVNKPAVSWQGKKLSLKQAMQVVIKNDDIKIIPKRFEKIYFHWIDNLRDWCISRQIWWGHRIPVWYQNQETEKVYVGIAPPEGSGWQQDPDTLDTWFSSALWTWSTLIDPKLAQNQNLSLDKLLQQSPDFQRFHPTDLMETGYDILFFWVARMILATTYATDQIPFKTVYLHGLVRTRDGRKMSKSEPDTMIDPLDIVPQYGADALRLAMLIGQAPGNDTRLYKEKIAGYRNFCNKLWNVARYILAQPYSAEFKPQSLVDKWLLTRLNTAIEAVTADIENYRLGGAGAAIYSLLWDDFADWYLEASKHELNPGVLYHGLETILKLAHPFAPFITEAIWQQLPSRPSDLIISDWPKPAKSYAAEAKAFGQLQQVVNEIRNLKAELNINKPNLSFSDKFKLGAHAELIKQLAGLASAGLTKNGSGLALMSSQGQARLELEPAQLKAYHANLTSKHQQLQKRIKDLQQQLANKSFVSSAPKAVVTSRKSDLADTKNQLELVNRQLKQL